MTVSKNKIFLLLIALLAAMNIFYIFQYENAQKEAQLAKTILNAEMSRRRVLGFTREFVDKVLRAKGEVSFEDRLKLENMVRNLNDQAILGQWNKFVNSKTQAEAQEEVKNLLTLLVHKM